MRERRMVGFGMRRGEEVVRVRYARVDGDRALEELDRTRRIARREALASLLGETEGGAPAGGRGGVDLRRQAVRRRHASPPDAPARAAPAVRSARDRDLDRRLLRRRLLRPRSPRTSARGRARRERDREQHEHRGSPTRSISPPEQSTPPALRPDCPRRGRSSPRRLVVRGPHRRCGEDNQPVGASASRNASTTVVGQAAVARAPARGSTVASTMPCGTSKSRAGRPAVARFMKAVQIGSAACAPLSPSGLAAIEPDPHDGHEVGRVAGEPRVAVVVGRAGLAGGGTRKPCGPRARCRCRGRWRPRGRGSRGTTTCGDTTLVMSSGRPSISVIVPRPRPA